MRSTVHGILLTGVLSGMALKAGAMPIGGKSALLSGQINASAEWTVPVVWGDGLNELSHIWSVGFGGQSGYGYGSGSGIPESTVDIYNAGVLDPLTVTDASAFIYTGSYIEFMEGETLFFRGLNGFYGAWVIEDIYEGNRPEWGTTTYLDGSWFFQSAGGSDFTIASTQPQAVPEPGSLVLMGLGLAGVWMMRLRRPTFQGGKGRPARAGKAGPLGE